MEILKLGTGAVLPNFMGKMDVPVKQPSAQDNINQKKAELLKGYVETLDSFKNKKAEVNKDGLFLVNNYPYTGVIYIENEDKSNLDASDKIIKYSDGRPTTLISTLSTGKHVEEKLVEYEYDGTSAVTRREVSVHSDYPTKVPRSIQEETKIF